MNTITVKHELDIDGTPIVRVSLSNVNQSAVLFQDDYNRLMSMGVDTRWRLSQGQVLEKRYKAGAPTGGHIQPIMEGYTKPMTTLGFRKC